MRDQKEGLWLKREKEEEEEEGTEVVVVVKEASWGPEKG